MRSLWTLVLAFACTTNAIAAGQLIDGVMTIEKDGERVPFFPLGSWSGEIAPDELALLGMNTSFMAAPRTEDRFQASVDYMRACAEKDIQVIQYLSFGGREAKDGWAPDEVRVAGNLATEPNLLAWNVGDDIYVPGLASVRQTAGILREIDPTIPTTLDCAPSIGLSEEGKRTFSEFIDIMVNYDYPLPDVEYPLPGNAFRKHQTFFDEQREVFNRPLWTWTQVYMWHWTGQALNVGLYGAGPYPEPEQLRLLLHSELNRNVRGLFCFSHREIDVQPELAAEVALAYREIGLFNDQLAAGEWVGHLPASDPEVDAASFTYDGDVVLSVAILGEEYQHWVHEAVLTDLTVDVPWADDRLPEAYLIATPDVLACSVERIDAGHVRVTIPRLEVAGLVLLTTDTNEVEQLRADVAAIPGQIRSLIVPAAFARIQEVNEVAWQSGAFRREQPEISQDPVDAGIRSSVAVAEGDYDEAVREWRTALRLCRVALDSVMRTARGREYQLIDTERPHLRTPYGLHNIQGLAQAPPNDQWRFIRTWRVAGPYDLRREDASADGVPPGFSIQYAPETGGTAIWQSVSADLSGKLDFLPYFDRTENVIAYARCRIVAPRDMDVTVSLGSNDGAKVFVNGEERFFNPVPKGRKAFPHQEQFSAHLRMGDNEILAKVANFGANWRLFLALEDPDRELVIEPR